jgi:alcohol dehydrogenase (cytochrome c)
MKTNFISSCVKTTLVVFLSIVFFTVPTIAQPGNAPGDWLTYNRTYSGERYSPLKQINTTNVKQVHLLHIFNLGKDVSSMQTGPVVINGVMYFTTDTVTYAINATSGMLKWKRIRPVEKPVGYGANHGVAYLHNKLFRGASDGHVFALNASDGKVIWDVALDVAGPGVSIPMAPIAWNGMVFIGNAGGDNAGIIGHMYALDANDGHVIWKFNTVPDSGPAHETWPAAAKGIPISGGAFWTSISLDTKNGVLYIPAGNPAPDFDIELRENGEELYTNCLIALDTKTGKMLGYIQLVKNDNHDWDVDSPPALFTTKNGKQMIASANKDGLLSVIDRSLITNKPGAPDSAASLRLLYQVPTTTRENVDAPLSREKFVRFKPGTLGGCEWNGAAYSPAMNLIFTGANDWATAGKLFPLDSARMMPATGGNLFGGIMKFDPPENAMGWVTAFNAKDGSVKWKFKSPAPILAGVTPTAGGLVFTAAQNGDVYAFNAQTGKVLWKSSTDLPNGGGVISYAVNGKQYIAVAAGMKAPLWPKPSNASKILIYGL